MSPSEIEVFSIDETFMVEHGVVAMLKRRLECVEQMDGRVFNLDGQLIPCSGVLHCVPTVDQANEYGCTWTWIVAEYDDSANIEIAVNKARRFVNSVPILERSKHKGDHYSPLPFDASEGRVAFLIADIGSRWMPNAFGFTRGFAAAGIPMLRMHGHNIGPTWGHLKVSVDWEATFGPELVFSWDDLRGQVVQEDDLPGPPFTGTYAGEMAMKACYDAAEKTNGKRGVPYKFTPTGIV